MNAPLEWLLAGPAWIEYRTRLDLLGESEQDSPVIAARQAMLADPLVMRLSAELREWPWKVIASHKSAGQPFHKLTFLADLGIRSCDPQMEGIVARILSRQSAEGPFQLPTNVPAHYGGSGEDEWAWALCDAPLIVYALLKFGLEAHPAVLSAGAYLTGLITENGWPCAVSPQLGKFRGPGRKEDPCPFANLAMLKALSAALDGGENRACQAGAEVLLGLWQDSLTRHPYIFYMGTDFRKLKVPFVWYDLVHVLDVLSRFPRLRRDPRLLDMADVLRSKMDPQGRFRVESLYTAWKDWEFGQKKEPSRWLTLAAWRILGRIEGIPKISAA